MGHHMNHDGDLKLSKKLAKVLRHRAADLGLNVSTDGYIAVSRLLKLHRFDGISEADIRRVVDNNEKMRYDLKLQNRKWHIRANQGHSVGVPIRDEDIYEAVKSVQQLGKHAVCAHGTTKDAWASIESEGLKVMGRQHVHFATALPESGMAVSGMRSDCEIIIHLDVPKLLGAGMELWRSKNDVVLCGGRDGVVPPDFFLRVVEHNPDGTEGRVLLGAAVPQSPPSALASSSSAQAPPTTAPGQDGMEGQVLLGSVAPQSPSALASSSSAQAPPTTAPVAAPEAPPTTGLVLENIKKFQKNFIEGWVAVDTDFKEILETMPEHMERSRSPVQLPARIAQQGKDMTSIQKQTVSDGGTPPPPPPGQPTKYTWDGVPVNPFPPPPAPRVAATASPPAQQGKARTLESTHKQTVSDRGVLPPAPPGLNLITSLVSAQAPWETPAMPPNSP